MDCLDIGLINLDLFKETKLMYFSYYYFILHYLMIILIQNIIQKLFMILKKNPCFSNKNHRLLVNYLTIDEIRIVHFFNLAKFQDFNLFVIDLLNLIVVKIN